MRSPRLTGEAIALYALTSLIAVLATAPLDVWSRLVVATITTLVAVAVAWLLRVFVSRLTTLLLVAFAVGAVRGAVLVAVLTWFGAAERPDVLRVLSSTVSAVIWLTILALAVSGRDAYRRQYAAAVRQVASRRADERLDALPEVIDLKSALGVVADATVRRPSEQALRDAAAVLRHEVEQRVRPLSHRIWFSAGSLQPHARLGRLVRDAVITFPVPVWPVVIVWTLSSIIGAPVIYGTVQGVVSALVCGALLLALLLVGRELVKRFPAPWLGPCLLAASSVVPVIGTVVVIHMLGFTAAGSASLATFVLVPLAIGALLVTAASIALGNADRALILRIVEDRANALDPWPSSDVSAYLHNSLQSELAALALQLDQAEPGSREAQAAVERLAALASRSIAADFRAQRETPMTRLAAGAAAWRGIADVRVDVAPDIDIGDERLPAVVQAVEEITSNAVRHGGAKNIRFSVSASKSRLVIDVWSDGTLSAVEAPGMGARWLQAISIVPVAIQPSADGTALRLEL